MLNKNIAIINHRKYSAFHYYYYSFFTFNNNTVLWNVKYVKL